MTRNQKILIGAVLLAAATYFIISRKPWSNIKGEKSDFAVSDTAAITRIFIADKSGHHVLLEKESEGNWKVDHNYEADITKVNMVKATLHDVAVLHPVPESQFNTIVSVMASDAKKVELYKGDELFKTIYVGEATPEGTGTYMMIEGSSIPFVTHIPGFIGYLTPRFNPYPVKWKSKLVFNYSMDQIEQLKVTYPENIKGSFEINNSETPVVTSEGKTINADPSFVKYYLSSFQRLYLEGYDEDIPEHEVDSVRKITPYCVIELKAKNGTLKKITVIHKAIDQRTKERYDEKGHLLPYDHDKYFAFVDGEKEMAYVQQYNFGKLFKTSADFSSGVKGE